MTPFRVTCEKTPATGARGMVLTNHPMGSAAGYEILAAGGNAVDAAVGTLLGAVLVALLPGGAQGGDSFLTGIGFSGGDWLWLVLIPPLTAAVAFAATRGAARRMLERQS